MDALNLAFGWFWIWCGFTSGAVIGVFFHRPDWLGGYDAWPRRMVRLGHIAFFGTGILNLLFAFTVCGADLSPAWLADIASWGFVIGAVLMPMCCFASAWRRGLRHLFPAPVAALSIAGAATFLGVVL